MSDCKLLTLHNYWIGQPVLTQKTAVTLNVVWVSESGHFTSSNKMWKQCDECFHSPVFVQIFKKVEKRYSKRFMPLKFNLILQKRFYAWLSCCINKSNGLMALTGAWAITCVDEPTPFSCIMVVAFSLANYLEIRFHFALHMDGNLTTVDFK